MYSQFIMIAPYSGLVSLFENVIGNMGIEIEVCEGELKAGLQKAVEAQKNGKAVVISRGGTATLIKAHLDIPVVEIQVTGYDLLRTIYKYKGQNLKIAVIGYQNIINGVSEIAKILDMDIVQVPIENESEIYQALENAKQQHVEVVIGDSLASRHAKNVGLAYDLIESGEEAIYDAIQNAVSVYEATSIEKAKNLRLEGILSISQEGIIAIDKEEYVILYNSAAERIFEMPKAKVLGKKVTEVIPNTRLLDVLRSGEKEINNILSVNKHKIIANRVPIQVNGKTLGVVANFQDVTKIEELENLYRKTVISKGMHAKHRFEEINSKNETMKNVIRLAKKYSQSDSTVLIYGESGTGKEWFAQSIHNASSRSNMPFVAINCAALPGAILESELFGYEEGAFTGAKKGGKKGLFELAHQGSIFLDEISEMDIQIQARILRVIQEKEVMRLGDDKIIPINVRIIAATNQPLNEAVEKGIFREDLYYRLNVLKIDIPPLRERLEDINDLCDYFVMRHNRKNQKNVDLLPEKFIEVFKEHNWPGNIREFENVIEKLMVASENGKVDFVDFELIMNTIQASRMKKKPENSWFETLLDEDLETIEYHIIKRILELEGFNKTAAAKRLNINRVTLNNKLKHHMMKAEIE